MTTAHRPTWKAAVGQANEGGWAAGGAVSHQTSALDAPAHTKLKFRQAHQVVDKKRALETSLLALEEAQASAKNIAKHIGRRPADPAVEALGQQRLLKQTAEVDLEKIKKKYDDSDVDDGAGGGDGSSESDLDADSDLNDGSSDDDDDDEDDEAALQAELAKIRAERVETKRRQEEKIAVIENAAAEEAAVLGNPLLHAPGAAAAGVPTGGRVKRRWNDDVVFRNQAKNEPAPIKRFINDTIRNDFHKRFLNKFIR